MAKTVKYDREKVVEKASNLYWEKGFHATSMRTLQDVIDMRPGSIYACFGSKEALFKEALQHYAKVSMDNLETCKADPAPLKSLKLFVKNRIIESHHHKPSGMCMLSKTIAELTDANAELLDEAKRLLQAMEASFAEVIAQAIVKGELDESKDPIRLGRYVQIQLMGLRTYIRANDGDVPIDQLVDEMFENGPFWDKPA